jgi:hypothetical protein
MKRDHRGSVYHIPGKFWNGTTEFMMDDREIAEHKAKIDNMTQVDMARLWRFAPSGHPYFIRDNKLSEYFASKFNGFTPEISKEIGW